MNINLKEYPVDSHGNMIEHVGYYKAKQFIPNKPFKAELKYLTYSKGRSSIKFHFKDNLKKSWAMFATDFDKIIPLLREGTIRGWWMVRKSGANYGLCYLGDENEFKP